MLSVLYSGQVMFGYLILVIIMILVLVLEVLPAFFRFGSSSFLLPILSV